MAGPILLVMDGATGRTTVALRRAPDGPVHEGSAVGPERGAAGLGVRLGQVMADAATEPGDLAAVGVGTGPGSFTGSRVALATAKALAWSLGIPIVGIPTTDGLRRAAAASAPGPIDAATIAVVQVAGARDHYLTLPGATPRLVPAGTDLGVVVGRHPVIALDVHASLLGGCSGPAGADPSRAGAAAREGLGRALLGLLAERLAEGRVDDPSTLVPGYVALPRGIEAAMTWTPDLR